MRVKKSILLPDIHHPFHNKKAIKAIFKFMGWFQPDEVIIMGDGLEMQAINHWQNEKGNKKFLTVVFLAFDLPNRVWLYRFYVSNKSFRTSPHLFFVSP